MGNLLSVHPQKKFAVRRFSLFVLAFGLTALSFAVFNWGLQYKLSFYLNSPSSASQAPAKLWLGKTSAPSASVEIQQQPQPSSVAQTAWAGLLLFLCTRLSSWMRLEIPWKLQVRTALHAFFFRPPPALA